MLTSLQLTIIANEGNLIGFALFANLLDFLFY